MLDLIASVEKAFFTSSKLSASRYKKDTEVGL